MGFWLPRYSLPLFLPLNSLASNWLRDFATSSATSSPGDHHLRPSTRSHLRPNPTSHLRIRGLLTVLLSRWWEQYLLLLLTTWTLSRSYFKMVRALRIASVDDLDLVSQLFQDDQSTSYCSCRRPGLCQDGESTTRSLLKPALLNDMAPFITYLEHVTWLGTSATLPPSYTYFWKHYIYHLLYIESLSTEKHIIFFSRNNTSCEPCLNEAIVSRIILSRLEKWFDIINNPWIYDVPLNR